MRNRKNLFPFFLCATACGILVPPPGIELVPSALKVQSLNYCTIREVFRVFFPWLHWSRLLRVDFLQSGAALCCDTRASPCGGFSCCGAGALEPGLSHCTCPVACGIFPDQGSNPHPLHWKADSLPLDHQGSPSKSSLTEGCSGFLRSWSRSSVPIFAFSP